MPVTLNRKQREKLEVEFKLSFYNEEFSNLLTNANNQQLFDKLVDKASFFEGDFYHFSCVVLDGRSDIVDEYIRSYKKLNLAEEVLGFDTIDVLEGVQSVEELKSFIKILEDTMVSIRKAKAAFDSLGKTPQPAISKHDAAVGAALTAEHMHLQ